MAKRESEAVRKFVPGMRKMSELAIDDFEFEVVASPKGMRSKSNIEAVLGREGLLTLIRLSISYNLPHGYGFMIADGQLAPDGKHQFIVMPISFGALADDMKIAQYAAQHCAGCRKASGVSEFRPLSESTKDAKRRGERNAA